VSLMHKLVCCRMVRKSCGIDTKIKLEKAWRLSAPPAPMRN
jgi:hypothetical protein